MNDTDILDALRAYDPARYVDPPPVPADLAEWRRRAQDGRTGLPDWRVRARIASSQGMLRWRRRLQRRRRAIALTAITVVVAALLSPPAAGAYTPAMLTLPAIDQPARAYLESILAGLVTSGPVSAGPVTYVRQQTWSLDTTATDVEHARRVFAQDVQVWRAPDGSGRRCVTDLPGQPAGTIRATHVSAADAPAPCGPLSPSGGLMLPFNRSGDQPGDDLATDPTALIGEFATGQPISEGPEFLLRAVTDAYQFYVLGPRHRAAVVTILATIQQLRYRGPVTDRANRAGLAFSLRSGTAEYGVVDDLIVLDPRTAQLLSFEEITLVRPKRSLVPAPCVTRYTLYLAGERVASAQIKA